MSVTQSAQRITALRRAKTFSEVQRVLIKALSDVEAGALSHRDLAAITKESAAIDRSVQRRMKTLWQWRTLKASGGVERVRAELARLGTVPLREWAEP